MRFLIGLIFAVASAAPAVACNEDLISISDWTASSSADGRNIRTEVSADLRYNGERPYRMIQGAVLFTDALGNALVSVPLSRDQTVEPGMDLTAEGSFIASDSRITSINRDDVAGRVCVWSIVYSDGSVEQF